MIGYRNIISETGRRNDPYWGSVVLALPMHGANNSTVFWDLAGNSFSRQGTPVISTAQSKFDGSSGYFYSSGNYLYLANSTKFDFGSSDFTIEFFARTTQSASLKGILSKRTTGGAANTNWLVVCDNGALKFYASDGSSYTVSAIGGGNISDGVWHHCAVSRSGSTFNVFVDGSIVGTSTWSGSISSTSRVQYIGTDHPNNLSEFNGYLDDIRITKGVARYTSVFTPPTYSYF